MKKIPFYRHNLGEAELREIRKVLHGPILTTGAQVAEFEKKFSRYLGCRDTVACTSWTGAAHITLLALGIQPGDEVITSPLTFVATATAIIQAGGVPCFVDCEKETGNLDVNLVEDAITAKTKFIMPIHLYGRMCDMSKLRKIADKHRLKIVEDAAHCIEGSRDGVRPAQFSNAACFSFFATKNIACGEGGAVSFNDPNLSIKLRRLRLHGITKTAADREREGYSHYEMPEFGWKYNMDNIHASILLGQLKKLKTTTKARRHLGDFYRNQLKAIDKIKTFEEGKNEINARHLMPILVNEKTRDIIIKKLQSHGIQAMVNYRPVHQLKFFKDIKFTKNKSFPNAEAIGKTEISLPFYPKMTKSDILYVIKKLRYVLRRLHA